VVTEADIDPDDVRILDGPWDVVFPVLHGEFGEDGQLQALLEQRKLRYVGSDAAASRLAMDKDAAKRAWSQAGLPTAAWTTLDSPANLSAMGTRLMPPVVVKPVAEGSSIGISICETEESLRETVSRILQTHGKVLVEKRLVGPELTVAILGTTTLPIIQVKPAADFYDYETKYTRNDTSYLFEPEISDETYQRVREIAIRAFDVLGCRDYSRVDLIVDKEEGPQLLEINTIPGFTPHSLLPKAAARAGIEFDSLVDRLVRMALQRHG
jgi:D-alanine-D-alanine ligase